MQSNRKGRTELDYHARFCLFPEKKMKGINYNFPDALVFRPFLLVSFFVENSMV